MPVDNGEPLYMAGKQLEMPDAEVWYYPALFSAIESQVYLESLTEKIEWQEVTARMFGKPVKLPRLVAWYGDPGKTYTYSGQTHNPLPWTDYLLRIRDRIRQVADSDFNSVLLNLYRDGQDSIAWHSDDEPELGPQPEIASVSFGSIRRFEFRHKENPEIRTALELTPGSLLLMRGSTQQFWKHRINKTRKPIDPRINLTFRTIQSSN